MVIKIILKNLKQTENRSQKQKINQQQMCFRAMAEITKHSVKVESTRGVVNIRNTGLQRILNNLKLLKCVMLNSNENEMSHIHKAALHKSIKAQPFCAFLECL